MNNELDRLHQIIAKVGIEAVRKEIEIAASLEGGYDKELVDNMDKYEAAGQEKKEIFALNLEGDFDFREMDPEDQESWNDAEEAQAAARKRLEELVLRSAMRRF